MSVRDEFKILHNFSRYPEEVRLLKLLGQLMAKGNFRDFDVGIKHLFLINREYQGHAKHTRIIIDHTACEILRGHTRDLDIKFAPYQTNARLKQLSTLINKINGNTI